MQRRGQYPPPPGASDIPGLEVAGTIDEVGDGVIDWHPGDRVCALVAGGGSTGIMTFLVGRDGRVYERDLGEKTDEAVEAMKKYDPDGSWKLVSE